MKTIYNIIQESLELNNLLYLLDKWFETHENEKQEFMEIIFNCQHDHSIDNLKKYLNDAQQLKTHIQEFISFLNEDIHYKNKEYDEDNYLYQLGEIIKQLIGYKHSKNTYIKKGES